MDLIYSILENLGSVYILDTKLLYSIFNSKELARLIPTASSFKR
jgi:hypothetical protein